MHDNELRACFGSLHSPYANNICCEPEIAATVGIIFDVFCYDAATGRDSNQSPPRQRADALRVMPKSRVCMLISLYV